MQTVMMASDRLIQEFLAHCLHLLRSDIGLVAPLSVVVGDAPEQAMQSRDQRPEVWSHIGLITHLGQAKLSQPDPLPNHPVLPSRFGLAMHPAIATDADDTDEQALEAAAHCVAFTT